jgi:hypothetical protein
MSALHNLTDAEHAAFAEERLAALYFIAAAAAFNAHWSIFGWLMVAKGCIDTIAAVFRWNVVRRLRARASQGQAS